MTDYSSILSTLADWEPYLLAESRLPGPRSNLELLQAAVDQITADQVHAWLGLTFEQAPENTPQVFLVCCAVVGIGRFLAEEQADDPEPLRHLANDPRWRVRESVAMALQRIGDRSVDRLLEIVHPWVAGTLLEQRAVMAALCEPRLLHEARHAQATLELLDQITRNLQTVDPARRRADDFQALRKGLGYGWSVAIVALPEVGCPRFEAWLSSPDSDVRWLIRENLKKNRLLKMDAAWTARMQTAAR